VNRKTQIGPRRKQQRAPATSGHRFDGTVDRRSIDCLSISCRAKASDIEQRFRGVLLGLGLSKGNVSDGRGKGQGRELENITAVHVAAILAALKVWTALSLGM